MRLLALLVALSIAACGRTGASENGLRDDDGQIALRRTQVFVIAPNRVVPADELAAAVRTAGFPCQNVTSLGRLELNGKALDNYKLDCARRSYLLTWLDGGSRIRPWSGAILEASPPSHRTRP